MLSVSTNEEPIFVVASKPCAKIIGCGQIKVPEGGESRIFYICRTARE